MIKHLLFFLLLSCGAAAMVQAQENLNFNKVEKDTYHYYMNQQWDSLVTTGKAGLHQDIDYFYLRVRMGMAYYFKGNYSKAITHLNKALEYNSGDTIAQEYLYYAYNDFSRALYKNALAKKIHPAIRKRIIGNAPLYKNTFVPMAGGQFDQVFKVDNITLKGGLQNNIYGEVDYPLDFYFFGMNYKHYFNGVALNVSYNHMDSHRDKKAVLASGFVFNDKYNVGEHDIYANSEISLNNKITIIPALQYQYMKYSKFKTVWDSINGIYSFPDTNYRYNNIIASLGFYKDISTVSLGLTLSYGNLYKKNIYQGAFILTWFPFGNMKLYTTTTLAYLIMPSTVATVTGPPGSKQQSNINSSGDKSHPVIEEAIGGRLSPKLWLEAQGAFNGLRNYNKADAAVVYNTPDQVKYLVGLTAVYEVTKTLELSVGYQFLQKEITGQHLIFTNKGPALITDNYTNNSHNIYGGIKWKL